MVLILGYNNVESDFINDILDRHHIEYKYSLLEQQILKADKIILPNTINFNSTYRKMNMMNLFSILKIVNKPCLGINGGLKLMCNNIIEKYKCGLGFFPVDIEHIDELIGNNYRVGKIYTNNNSILVSNNLASNEVKFFESNHPNYCEYSTSYIDYDNVKYSLTFEKNNYYGVELNFKHNPNIAEEILMNFIKKVN